MMMRQRRPGTSNASHLHMVDFAHPIDNRKRGGKRKSRGQGSLFPVVGIAVVALVLLGGGLMWYNSGGNGGNHSVQQQQQPVTTRQASYPSSHYDAQDLYPKKRNHQHKHHEHHHDVQDDKEDLKLPPLEEFYHDPLEKPGDMQPLKWKRDDKKLDTYGRVIALPPELTEAVEEFAIESGLMQKFRDLLYGPKKMKIAEQRLFRLVNHRQWTAMTPDPSAHWIESDIHWVDAANEENYEETLRVLEEGNFDVVLDAVGKQFKSKGLMVAGMGFIITSKTGFGNIHHDLPEGNGFWFDLLFPLVLPEEKPASLLLGDDKDQERVGKIDFTHDVGILISGETPHGTHACNFRDTEEYRVAVSVYIVDVDESNAELVASDGTALFPVPGESGWLLAQQGRLWNPQGTASLKTDKGRKPFSVKDTFEDRCVSRRQHGMCDTDLMRTRRECPRSCSVFVDDARYYDELFPPKQTE